jgi:mycofactocin precursor
MSIGSSVSAPDDVPQADLAAEVEVEELLVEEVSIDGMCGVY